MNGHFLTSDTEILTSNLSFRTMPQIIHKLLLLFALILSLNSCLIEKREVVYEVKNLKTNEHLGIKQKVLLVISPASLNVGDIYHV